MNNYYTQDEETEFEIKDETTEKIYLNCYICGTTLQRGNVTSLKVDGMNSIPVHSLCKNL